MPSHGLPRPECHLGYPEDQVARLLGPRIGDFWRFMNGQGQSVCSGRVFDHESRTHSPSPCGGVHGPVVFACDLERFMARESLRIVVPAPGRRGSLAETLRR